MISACLNWRLQALRLRCERLGRGRALLLDARLRGAARLRQARLRLPDGAGDPLLRAALLGGE